MTFIKFSLNSSLFQNDYLWNSCNSTNDNYQNSIIKKKCSYLWKFNKKCYFLLSIIKDNLTQAVFLKVEKAIGYSLIFIMTV